MWEQIILASLPLLLLLILAAWGVLMKGACRFKMPPDPTWPLPENPGLALELAASPEYVDAILGPADTDDGEDNRKTGRRFQYLDFVFIPLYVLFLSVAALLRVGWLGGWIVVGPALLTAICDVAEDIQILRLLRGRRGVSARTFGRAKWFFYFASIAAEGFLFFFVQGPSFFRTAAGRLFGLALIALAIGGIISSLKGSFAGINSAAKLSALALLALALSPLFMLYPHSWGVLAEYAVFLRVTLLLGAILIALPFIAFYSGAKTLLRGLFDLTPLSLFVVTIAALAVAGTICMTASVIIKNGTARFGVGPGHLETLLPGWAWLPIMAGLSLPIVGYALWFSVKQKHGLLPLSLAVLSGASLTLAATYFLIMANGDRIAGAFPYLSSPRFASSLGQTTLFRGYIESGAIKDHLRASTALILASLLYFTVGAYGYHKLGKKRTVPALCAVLMLMLMLGWLLSGVTFFFDAWHIPALLIVSLVGILTAQSKRSDHFYDLKERMKDSLQAPDPGETITASKGKRIIVVAANGGGIQASAWAAQVLYGLNEECKDLNKSRDDEPFRDSLRMISSVSGGSVGSACFVHWLANRKTATNPEGAAREPHVAAAMSSLDEVAWGLVWPDFLRALVPWLFGWLIGRGRALEQAFLLNSTEQPTARGKMDEPLSNWNRKVIEDNLPAVIMNATITETGNRLLLGTTQLTRNRNGQARVDATELHTINRVRCDVGVATAARLSASFPYVTPAARAKAPGPLPHVVDGGYYDNYGMATLVEWLDEALTSAKREVESVLVIQIHGAPVNPGSSGDPLAQDCADHQPQSRTPIASQQTAKQRAQGRDWFYQVFAPLQTLIAVRDAGQVAHNNIELELLQAKWSPTLPVHSVTFEFCNPDVPLSWHLTPSEIDEIRQAWNNGSMKACKQLVENFLKGQDQLNCGCLNCRSVSTVSHKPSESLECV